MILAVRSINSIRATRSEGGTGGNIHEWERREHGCASAGEGFTGGVGGGTRGRGAPGGRPGLGEAGAGRGGLVGEGGLGETGWIYPA
jgi:hypothetical protein